MRRERRGLENIDCADSGSHFYCCYSTDMPMGRRGTYIDVELCPLSDIPL